MLKALLSYRVCNNLDEALVEACWKNWDPGAKLKLRFTQEAKDPPARFVMFDGRTTDKYLHDPKQ